MKNNLPPALTSIVEVFGVLGERIGDSTTVFFTTGDNNL